MDIESSRRIALMSIRPQYAESILLGEKTIEFRKTRLRENVDTVLIYSTKPVCLVVGSFTVGGVVVGPPRTLWNEHRHTAGIGWPALRDYYKDARLAVGILIERAARLCDPIRLNELSPSLRPPQSFCYLPDGLHAALKADDRELTLV